MSEKFEVSFNSPQCGWMSIGFKNDHNEFNSTTAHAPHERALPELLQILTNTVTAADFEQTLRWNRNPEAFDFVFAKRDNAIFFEIFQYPTEERLEKESVFTHAGDTREFCEAFHETFAQLYEARETDEFEANWKQPFPFADYEKFVSAMKI